MYTVYIKVVSCRYHVQVMEVANIFRANLMGKPATGRRPGFWCSGNGSSKVVFQMVWQTRLRPYTCSGWWLTYSSEKDESQLGWWNSQYMERKNVPNHQPVLHMLNQLETFQVCLRTMPKNGSMIRFTTLSNPRQKAGTNQLNANWPLLVPNILMPVNSHSKRQAHTHTLIAREGAKKNTEMLRLEPCKIRASRTFFCGLRSGFVLGHFGERAKRYHFPN